MCLAVVREATEHALCSKAPCPLQIPVIVKDTIIEHNPKSVAEAKAKTNYL